jgi:hypothetical protein
MAGPSYKVCVIVDRQFGDKLAELDSGIPVWIVDSPTNSPVIRRLWKERPNRDHLTGITAFNDVESSTAETVFLAEIDSIDLHHGSYSAGPPYTVIEVIGMPLTERVKNALAEFGCDDFHGSSAGFTATRPEPSDR